MSGSGTPRNVAWLEPTVVVDRANPAGRDLAAGDVHGHFDTLEQALEQIAFDPVSDRLFSVGDLVDRGPRLEAALAPGRSGCGADCADPVFQSGHSGVTQSNEPPKNPGRFRFR